MATLKAIADSDIKTTRSFLNQLIDVLQEDISASVSRRKYQSFVTGGIGPGVTSSLFQTVYDQDFTLQTANPIFDITVGLAPPDSFRQSDTKNSSGIAGTASTGYDINNKYLYPSSSIMMREKTDIYGQFAQVLLGDRSSMFQLPNDSTLVSSQQNKPVDAALFIAFKRLFSRDQIKRETFAMRFFTTASSPSSSPGAGYGPPVSSPRYNINLTATSGSAIYTDIGSAAARYFDVGGQYGYLVDASSTTNTVGLLYYDYGIVVLDIEKVVSGTQFIYGPIDAMAPLGFTILGGTGTETENKAKLVPDFLVSGSVDNVIDHFCYSRFGAGSLTAMTFQNVTNINSSLIFCRAMPDDFNYSSNPTYIEQTGDNQGRLTIYDPAQGDDNQETFTYVTTIGLYDNSQTLLAVAKLSRPVEKNPGRDLTFRVRLDF